MSKVKIIAFLKSKNPELSDKTAGILADKLLSKVTSDDQIQPVVESFDSAFGISEFADTLKSEGDRRFNEAMFKYSGKPDAPTPPTPQKKPADTEPGEPQDPMQQMFGMLKGLTTEIASLKSERQQESLKGQLFAKMDELKIPRALANNVSLADANGIDAAITGLQTTHAELSKAYGTPVQSGRPLVGGVNTAQVSQTAALDVIKGFSAGRTTSGNSLPVAPVAKG